MEELTHSKTAVARKIPNVPTPEAKANLTVLVMAVLDPLREKLGKPIRITSGYRGFQLNRSVGGSKTSQHCKGEAVDFVCDNPKDLAWCFYYIWDNLPFDQLIWEKGDKTAPAWVHVSFRDEKQNRGQVLEYDGKTYKPKKR